MKARAFLEGCIPLKYNNIEKNFTNICWNIPPIMLYKFILGNLEFILLNL